MGNFTPTKLKLKDLLADIDCGKIKLPSFQRDYKWTAPKVKKLLDSIQCDHPAGTLLFLAVDYNNLISQGLIPRSSAANKLSEAEANTPQLAAGKFIYTFLTNEANNFISDKLTYKYMDEIMERRGISEETFKGILSNHIIGEDSYSYMYQEKLKEFLAQRAEAIKNKFIEIGLTVHDVAKEQIDEQVDDEDLVSDIE